MVYQRCLNRAALVRPGTLGFPMGADVRHYSPTNPRLIPNHVISQSPQGELVDVGRRGASADCGVEWGSRVTPLYEWVVALRLVSRH